jgi:hypothetical protein
MEIFLVSVYLLSHFRFQLIFTVRINEPQMYSSDYNFDSGAVWV